MERSMKGKICFVAGLGVGYVLGTRAGRERYESIKKSALKLWNNPRVQKQVDTAEAFVKDKAPDVAEFALDEHRRKGRPPGRAPRSPDRLSPMATSPNTPKRSLLSLITDIPALIQELFHREVELLKAEVIAKLKALGVGAGLIAGAAVVLLFLIGTLLTAGILALGEVMPGWLAALLVAAFLLIVAVVLAFIGYRILKRGVPPVPTESIDSLQRDYRAIKGIGKRASS
jgi:membrane protein implicated in regulation of membrane protease activity